MSAVSELLLQEYTKALEEHLAGREEVALRRAYDAGRKAMAEGMGVLELVATHQLSVSRGLNSQTSDLDRERVLQSAVSCLAESLSPFEMVLRGVQDSNTRLEQSLSSLEFIEKQLRHQHEELIAAHRAVETQRSRYQQLFDFAPDGYLVTGIEGAIREANTAAAALLRTPKEMLPGQLLSEFLVKADRETFRQRLRELQVGAMERREDWQVHIEPRHGLPIPAVLSVVAERTPAATASLRWLIRDDTERKRAEKERARLLLGHARALAERRSEFLAEASSLLVGTPDVEESLAGIARLTVAYLGGWCFVSVVDPAGAVRQLDVAYADYGAADLANDLRNHCLFKRTGARTGALLANPHVVEPLTGEWYSQAADGAVHAALLCRLHARAAMVLPLRIRDRLLGVLTLMAGSESRPYRPADLVLGEDLARRCALALENARLYREVVAERDKAERASRTKDEFVAILGHELRNPLTLIAGWTRMLENHPLISEDPSLAEGVRAMSRNTAVLSRLVGDCLDLSAISRGKLRLEHKTVDLNHIVAESAEAVRDMAAAHGLQVSTDLAPVSVPVGGDAFRLQQVVMNLLINAVKYTGPGGSISICSRWTGQEAEIAVTDTGIGILPEQLERIFEHYRQGRDSWLMSQSGLGLGLAIARQIVYMHGGRIWAESAGRNRGSTFRVRLPKAAPAQTRESPVQSAAAPAQPPRPGSRILLIEDSEDIQFLMKVQLEKDGHAVSIASNGRRGIEMAIERRPDVIISDIRMPLMDGYQMIRAIRAVPELSRTPAIALTGFGAAGDVEQALAAGFNAYISKPAEAEHLAAVIRQVTSDVKSNDAGSSGASPAAKSAKETI